MEWKRYRLLIIGGIALTLVAVVWALKADEQTGRETDDEDSEEAAGPLPTISADDIEEITIQRPDDEEATRLVRSEGSWRVAAPVEAEVNEANVNTAIRQLTDLSYVGRAARNPEHHERLEVDAEHGVHVTVRAGGESVLDMWIGGYQSSNTMVRLEGQDEVLMVGGNIKHAFNRPLRDWRNRTIVEVATAEVREMRFVNENGSFHVRKMPEPADPEAEGEGEDPEAEPAEPAEPALVWQQVLEAAEGEEPPAAIEEFTPARVNTLVNSYGSLSAQDFAGPEITEEAAGLGEGAATAVIISGEGASQTTLTLRIGNAIDAGQRYLQTSEQPIIYIVSSHVADRLLPDASTFQPQDEPPPTPGGGAMPGGMPGMPGGGGPGGGISEAQMQQIMQQLQAQGGH